MKKVKTVNKPMKSLKCSVAVHTALKIHTAKKQIEMVAFTDRAIMNQIKRETVKAASK